MLLIIIWMLCFHFVLKAAEIYLITTTSMHESRNTYLIWGALWAIVAVIGAVGFFWLSLTIAVPDLPETLSL